MAANKISRAEMKMQQAYVERQREKVMQPPKQEGYVWFHEFDRVDQVMQRSQVEIERDQFKDLSYRLRQKVEESVAETFKAREEIKELNARIEGVKRDTDALERMKTEENRKLKEKIAQLEDHIKGLEDAFKLIGNGQAT